MPKNEIYRVKKDDSKESQLRLLDEVVEISENIPYFRDKLLHSGITNFKPVGLEIIQINLGKLCNQACYHCHVNAGPNRTEMMSQENLQLCIDIIEKYDIPVVDITGGAPEMNPYFRWFVEECFKLDRRIIVRCNLTIFFENEKYLSLPKFYADHKVEVISSLPCYIEDNTDKVRGKGVFKKSIEALKLLNSFGYGRNDENLILNLVYNPAGAYIAGPQHSLEIEFKQNLKSTYGIDFNKLFSITNMPVSRFLDYLMRTNNYISYIENLVNAFNPVAAMGAMCLNMISVSWDGYLYDCDFNQMLGMKINKGFKAHISEFDKQMILKREVSVSQHCYGCTAGGGSSCNGETILIN